MADTLYLALGSNLDRPLAQLRRAARRLCAHPQFKLLAASAIYRSAPLGPAIQPHYLNAVLAVRCSHSPLHVLRLTQLIERTQGRRKRQHWGPRTLDIDLLLYGQRQVSHPRLRIPHRLLQERAFVVIPLLEIEPHVQLPDGQPLKACDASGLQRLKTPLLPRQARHRAAAI